MKQLVPKPFHVYNAFVVALCTVIAVTLVLPACQKDNTASVTERLMHKWAVVQSSDTLYTFTAAPQVTTYNGTVNDYMDFRTDGKRYSFINNKYDTANYTYSENYLKLNVGILHFNILILTNETMIIYEPHITTSTGYTASKVTLKR